MKRRNFLRALFLAPFAKPIIQVVYQELAKPKVDPVIARIREYCVGYKGAAYLQAGWVYAPYIPLYQTCMIYDKNGKHNETDYYRSQGIQINTEQLQRRMDNRRFNVYHDPITTF